MLSLTSTREIGGDFEAVSSDLLTEDPVTPPWERRHRDAAVTYLETGRQALAAAEAALRMEGRHRLVVPAFFCDSMVLPFVRRGWEIVPVPVGRDVFPVTSAVAAAIGDAQVATVLHAPYFGQDTPHWLVEELAAVRRAGARLVVDETHRLFAPSVVAADFYVASLRKTLPLVDGAYVAGVWTGFEVPVGGGVSDLGRIRAKAMAAKRRHLDGASAVDVHLALFRQADELVADRLAGHGMSRSTEAMMRRLDYTMIIQRRRSNACALATALVDRGMRLLADPCTSDTTPSHLVVVVPQPRALQAALAEQGIYCPVHWEDSSLVPVSKWPDRLLSIPVDQRYDVLDMRRIAEAISVLPRYLYTLTNPEMV